MKIRGWKIKLDLLATVIIFFSINCVPPRTYISAFYEYEFEDSRKLIIQQAGKEIEDIEDGNYVFWNMAACSAVFYSGNYKTADLYCGRATSVVDTSIGAGRGVVSLLSWESAKYFKGEQYERMALYYLRGLLNFLGGDYDKARASFNNALLVDKASNDPKYQEDNAAVFYMLAHTYKRLGNDDNARIALEKAIRANPKNPFLSKERFNRDNLILLIETGKGPIKVRDNYIPTIAHLTARPDPFSTVYVFIDGRKTKESSAELVNYFYQGKTQGVKGREAVQAVKGVAARVADELFCGGLARTVAGEADIRTWHFLPHNVLLFSTHVTPGLHTITLKFMNEKGEELVGYQQTHYYISVPQEGARFVLLRSGLCFHAKPET